MSRSTHRIALAEHKAARRDPENLRPVGGKSSKPRPWVVKQQWRLRREWTAFRGKSRQECEEWLEKIRRKRTWGTFRIEGPAPD